MYREHSKTPRQNPVRAISNSGGDPCEVLYDALERHGYQPRGEPDKFKSLCPQHDDHNPSLDVDRGRNGVPVIRCRSHDCDRTLILRRVNLTWRDLYPAGLRAVPRNHRPVDRTPAVRPVELRAHPPILSFLIALHVAGIGYRCTTDPLLYVIDTCPACGAENLWLHDEETWLRPVCWSGACSLDSVRAGLARRATEGERRAA